MVFFHLTFFFKFSELSLANKILLFQAFLAFSCRDAPVFWRDFLSSFRVISVSYQRQTPRAAACKNYEAFLPPLESWSSDSPFDFLSLKSALCILRLLLQMCAQLHPGQHHQVLPFSCLTAGVAILQLCQVFYSCFHLFIAV